MVPTETTHRKGCGGTLALLVFKNADRGPTRVSDGRDFMPTSPFDLRLASLHMPLFSDFLSECLAPRDFGKRFACAKKRGRSAATLYETQTGAPNPRNREIYGQEVTSKAIRALRAGRHPARSSGGDFDTGFQDSGISPDPRRFASLSLKRN
jgi:hypothetical protein